MTPIEMEVQALRRTCHEQQVILDARLRQLEELQTMHQLDMGEIVRLRRIIESMTEGQG